MTRAPAPRPSRPRHLLVVDDEPHIGLLLRPELESRGFQVSLARSLTDAKASLTGVDALLLDLHLPDGSGMEFLRELRGRPATRDLPVLVLTGEGGDRVIEEARRLGAGLLTKPFSPTKLAARLTTLVGELGAAGDAP